MIRRALSLLGLLLCGCRDRLTVEEEWLRHASPCPELREDHIQTKDGRCIPLSQVGSYTTQEGDIAVGFVDSED